MAKMPHHFGKKLILLHCSETPQGKEKNCIEVGPSILELRCHIQTYTQTYIDFKLTRIKPLFLRRGKTKL